MPETKSMLIVEGNDCVARLFVEIFSQRNWNVDAPRDGQSAVEALLGETPYDIILVSYRVPVISGIELLRLIRELECRKHTPVLMVSGSCDIRDEAIAAGASEVLYKPIEPDELVAAVMKHLSEARNEAHTDIKAAIESF